MFKVWFICGAFQGFGLELTKQLLASGNKVAATSRRKQSLINPVSPEPDNYLPLQQELARFFLNLLPGIWKFPNLFLIIIVKNLQAFQ